MNWTSKLTARQRIVAGFAVVMASAAGLAVTSLIILRWLDNLAANSAFSSPTNAAMFHAAIMRARGIVLGVGALGTLLSLASLWAVACTLGKVLKNLAQELGRGSEQVESASSQVAHASQSLAEGASEQAASIEQTSASLEEMASMTMRNAENARKANELARQTRTAAEEGAVNISQMTSAMEAIKGSSDDITKIIKTIDAIAFQTNLLALNAAVEAARAGEAGMGFAVVADEVRSLAQRSAKAAKETAEKIEDAISKTALGVDISGKVAMALSDIVTKARQVDELAGEVAGASSEQAQGITQINTAVGQMDKVTRNNAANAEESAAAAQQLSAQAEVMKQAVQGLRKLVGDTIEKLNPSNEHASFTISRSSPIRHRTDFNLASPRKVHSGDEAANFRAVAKASGNESSPQPSVAIGDHAPATARLNCWEYKKCGREAGGAKARELGICPAYPDHGHTCATMAGTLCGGKVQGSFAAKLTSCMQCKFFNSEHYDRKSAAVQVKQS